MTDLTRHSIVKQNLIKVNKLYSQSISTLERKADDIFSEFIRLRDTPGGIGKCRTCNKFLSFKDSDAGHFMSRGFKNTRYNEINVGLQCHSCNRFQEGRRDRHRDFIDSKYGIGQRYQIEFLAHQKCPDYKSLLVGVIEYYPEQIKKLKSNK